MALLVLVFSFLSITDSRPLMPWFRNALCIGMVTAVALGWFATRVRKGSTLTIGSATITFSLGVLLLAAWWSCASEPAIVMVLAVSTIAAVALGWVATRVRKSSPLTIGSVVLSFWIGAYLLVTGRSRDGDPAILVVLTTLAPILLASSWWALRVARRLHSRFPDFLSRPGRGGAPTFGHFANGRLGIS